MEATERGESEYPRMSRKASEAKSLPGRLPRLGPLRRMHNLRPVRICSPTADRVSKERSAADDAAAVQLRSASAFRDRPARDGSRRYCRFH